jgi:hypothetical protein
MRSERPSRSQTLYRLSCATETLARGKGEVVAPTLRMTARAVQGTGASIATEPRTALGFHLNSRRTETNIFSARLSSPHSVAHLHGVTSRFMAISFEIGSPRCFRLQKTPTAAGKGRLFIAATHCRGRAPEASMAANQQRSLLPPHEQGQKHFTLLQRNGKQHVSGDWRMHELFSLVISCAT